MIKTMNNKTKIAYKEATGCWSDL